MQYVHVIVPVAVPTAFTYIVPPAMTDSLRPGIRVLVPFGPKRLYTAIVWDTSDTPPALDTPLREVVSVIDSQPIVTPVQMRLWQWIADYYMSSLGSVMQGALPAALKLESETRVSINYDFSSDTTLPPRLQSVLDVISDGRLHTPTQVARALGIKNVMPHLNQLLSIGAIQTDEGVTDKYKPRSEVLLVLSTEMSDEATLQAQLNVLQRRAPKQYDLLMTFLQQAVDNGGLVLKRDLMRASDASPVALGGLLKKNILVQQLRQIDRIVPQTATRDAHPLNNAQQTALDAIRQQWETKDIVLLHGVTSSGKTELYIHLINEQLRNGRQVLYLVPEIALTTQLTQRLAAVFGEQLGVYHSRFTDAERVETYNKVLAGKTYNVMLGARSAVFLPFQRLGLVIVDEEHETSFKQQDPAPRYHARNVALVLARKAGAKTLLGTATPSLESYYNACTGRYGLVTLMERYGQVQLPEIRVVDIKLQRHRKEMQGPFSTDLLRAMREALERREQIILFQNRRGYAPQMECQMCGWNPRCTNCDVTLTHHRTSANMTCHYCGATYPIPPRCPNCGSQDLQSIGYGTERIEDDIQRIFPQVRVARMDLDTTRSRAAYERIISDFQHGRTDILVGTQMVTKGLDFERVSVVGILNADTMLNMPDFRSYERSFQMLSQVAGRAGRHSRQGLVILQTKSPELSVVRQVVANDFPTLYIEQMQEREAFHYPPFTRLVYIYLKHKDVRTVDALARDMATLLRRIFSTRVLGPDTPAVSRVQLLYIRKLMLKVEVSASGIEARRRLRQIQQYLLSQPLYRSAQMVYDVDPV